MTSMGAAKKKKKTETGPKIQHATVEAPPSRAARTGAHKAAAIEAASQVRHAGRPGEGHNPRAYNEGLEERDRRHLDCVCLLIFL